MSILERLTALLAPDDCLGCGREGTLLCRPCSQQYLQRPRQCFRCYRPAAASVCLPCISSIEVTHIQAAVRYEGVAKNLVARLKFAHNQAAARLMARLMYEWCRWPEEAVLTYVPATTKHVRERGFDQAALLTQELARLTGLPWYRMLARHGSQRQLGSTAERRRQQLQGAVRVVGNYHTGKWVIIIDDVLTTGSSLLVSAGALRDADATAVSAVVFGQAMTAGRYD